MTKRKATVEVCDNPECDAEFITEKGYPTPGYHLGKGYWDLAGGGPIPALYAHSEECIVPAIRHAIETS